MPLVHPNDLVISGWDISKLNMADAMARAQVLEYNLQEKLYSYMKDIIPLPAIYYPDFIAANQQDRADNVLPGYDKWAHLEQIRKDIRDFKSVNKLDKVIVLWTANTGRYCLVEAGVHDTAENLLNAIKRSHPELSPSTIYATASVLEGCSYINGSPQNTLVPGLIELAKRQKVFVVGDDFKTG
jgi:myo-inositol-1-phosphate synthase